MHNASRETPVPPLAEQRVMPMFGPNRPMQLLYVEDSPLDARLFVETMRDSGDDASMHIHHVGTLAQACAELAATAYDCILLDLGLPDGNGPANVTRLLQQRADVTIVVMTGDASDEIGLQAIHHGAQEYLVKGQIEGPALTRILRHAVQRNQLLQELKTLREREYFMATHDVLTGLPNRQLFEDRARQVLARAQRGRQQLALCYLDLDGFKPVNDNFGHATGDALLQAVASCLAEVVRDSDTVARVGGDEFVLLLYPLDQRREAEQVAGRIIEKIGAITHAGGHPVNINTSIGIGVYPEHGEGFHDLVHNADTAMYESKNNQRGGYRFYSDDMRGKSQLRQDMVDRINEGLGNAQFSAEFQPWIDTDTGEISGLEALLRWRDASGMIHTPDGFLRVAQESGQILQIAQMVNKSIVTAWRSWMESQLVPGQLALNLTARELQDTHYMREFAEMSDHAELPRNLTQLHINARESARLDQATLRTRLQQLRDMEYRLVLDRVEHDVLSGHTLEALDCFRELRFPVYALLHNDQALSASSRGFVSRLLELGRQHDIDVVAVGVETREQAQSLREMGCRYMQGRYYAPPMSMDRVSELLRR